MGDRHHDPTDHFRTTQPHAGITMKDNLFWPGFILLIVAVSGIPVERNVTARTPEAASSADKLLDNPSSAAQAGPMPPTSGAPRRAGSGVCRRITPGRFFCTMRLAAARAYVRAQVADA